MSELVAAQSNTKIRWRLLATASALTLCGATGMQDPALAEQSDRPTVWVELGGQLERVQNGLQAYLPPSFFEVEPRAGFEGMPSASDQRPARYAIGGEAQVLVAPHDSVWSFQAGVRYGRSNNARRQHQQSNPSVVSGVTLNGGPYHAKLTGFGDTVARNSEAHVIADFTAGRDVGLGFGRDSAGIFDFGVRFAQFTAHSNATLRAKPDKFVSRIPQPPNPFLPGKHKYLTNTHFHTFYGNESLARSFSGIGPTLSMSGSSSIAGTSDTVDVAFDWGANGAVLFGRQKVNGHQRTVTNYFTKHYQAGSLPKSTFLAPDAGPIGRSRNIVVPNIGGFAGFTFRHEGAKVSFGYRADFFFGAMDGGIETRRTSTVGFYGPYATISIGLGG